eukprot:216427_1
MSLSNTRKRKRESQQKQHKKIKLTSTSTKKKASGLRSRSTLCNLDIPNTANHPHPNPLAAKKESNLIRLSRSEISSCCSSTCALFTSYIYDTNGHSLHQILTLQHHLALEDVSCCIANCSETNDGTFYICLHCVFYCCCNAHHFGAHCAANAHYLYFELSSESIYCGACGVDHHSPWTDAMIGHFIGLSAAAGRVPQYRALSMHSLRESIWRGFDCIRESGVLGLRGVYNLGSTCYMTVMLQVFAHNKHLRNHYLSHGHSHSCLVIDCISCEVEQLFCDFYCGMNGAAVAISDLLGSTWRDDAYNLAGQEMHDCHELFISVTNLLHKTSAKKHRLDDEKLCQCIVHSTFRGLFCSELKCGNCHYVSQTVASFMEINLQIKKIKTIEEALRDYMESEPMPDYKCTKCGMKKQCNKDMTIHTLPHTLCLHLKRFEADELPASANQEDIETFGKIDDFIQFPLNKILDLAQFVNAKRRHLKMNRKKYKLQSMIVHTGRSLSSGHYLCYVRKDQDWFLLDDVNVHPVMLDTVRREKAYMLFYEAQ